MQGLHNKTRFTKCHGLKAGKELQRQLRHSWNPTVRLYSSHMLFGERLHTGKRHLSMWLYHRLVAASPKWGPLSLQEGWSEKIWCLSCFSAWIIHHSISVTLGGDCTNVLRASPWSVKIPHSRRYLCNIGTAEWEVTNSWLKRWQMKQEQAAADVAHLYWKTEKQSWRIAHRKQKHTFR